MVVGVESREKILTVSGKRLVDLEVYTVFCLRYGNTVVGKKGTERGHDGLHVFVVGGEDGNIISKA